MNDILYTEDSSTSREEYMEKLQNWINEFRKQNEQAMAFWQNFASQPQFGQNIIVSTGINNTTQSNHIRAYIYKIPPVWKRLAAEVIDFFILFMIKMFLTLIILESVDLIDIESNGFSALQKKLQDPKLAMQMSIELLTLEILHRCIVCCYETYWIVVQRATPGKHYMGLTVIEAVSIVQFQGQLDDIVVVSPATNLSIKHALLRSILKSTFIGLLLPICFVFLFFKFNRTGYDLITNSLVVENNPEPPMRQQR